MTRRLASCGCLGAFRFTGGGDGDRRPVHHDRADARCGVLALVRTGGNAGGGMVCARNLPNWGARVQVFGVSGSPDFDPVPAQQLAILDGPGVDASTGEVYEPAMKADATMTLALPKTGLGALQARAHVGELWLADIGLPPELYANPTIGVRARTPFNERDLIKLSA